MINIGLFNTFYDVGTYAWASNFNLVIAVLLFLIAVSAAAYESVAIWGLLIVPCVFFVANGFPLFSWYLNHPLDVFYNVSEYLIIGLIYSAIRWFFVCVTAGNIIKSKLEILNKRFAQVNSLGMTFEQWLISENYIPQASENKYRFTYWIFWWPFSIIGFALVDVIQYIGEWIVFLVSDTYTAIQRITFKIMGINF